MMNNNIEVFSRLSFEKLEAFDMHRSSLVSFVLVRNALITALTQSEKEVLIMSEQPQDFTQEELDSEDEEEEEEEVQEVWLDSCFNELDEDDDSSDSEEDDMPLSPQDNLLRPFFKKASFYINDEEEDDEDLICYDIPFLSLDSTF